MPKKKILVIYAFLILATLLAFWHVKDCEFLSFDDFEYITQNSHVQNGLTMDAIRWAFTSFHSANWHPLTWISHMIDVDLFDLNPQGHHVMNLLFHIANTLLLFFVFHRMTKAVWQSAFVAALFALHPLHVESVAWAAERKDVLSTFFWMLTMCAYCFYAERQGLWRYLSVIVCFALGLMAKPMLVTLPFVLLLLDYWPLGRFAQEAVAGTGRPVATEKKKSGKKRTEPKDPTATEKAPDARDWRTNILALLREKILLFILATASSVATYLVQQRWGAVQSMESIPFGSRAENAFVSYLMYIAKMIWPADLTIFYPYQKFLSWWLVLAAALFFIAVTLLVLWNAKKHRYLIVGWFWYVGTLIPVIGLVQAGKQARADRYTYIPLIGLFIIAAWFIPELLGRWRHEKKILFPVAASILLCFLVVTRIQVGYWQSNLSLFDHALTITKDSYVAYCNRGYAYAALGNHEQAIKDFDRAIEINPDYTSTYNTRGMSHAAMGHHAESIRDYDRAIARDSENAAAYNNRGNAYAALGNQEQAIKDFDKALAINPEYATAYTNRANAYAALAYPAQAITDYDKAIKINPRLALAYTNRGNVYAALGNHAQAIMDYDRALAIDPRIVLAYYNRGNAYAALENQMRAIKDYDAALAIDPRYALAYSSRGNAHAALGDRAQAIKDYDKALAIDPRLALAYINRGMAYASSGDHRQAITDYDKAIAINPRLAVAYRVRAVSYDRLGNRTRAYEDLKLAASLGDKNVQNYLRTQGITP